MGITSNDIAAQRAMLERGEEKRKADWKQAERERLRDPLISYAFAVMLITVGFCVVAVLGDISKSIQEVSQAIRLQTAQQSWLVEHYAKPVRHILPWKEDK